MMNASRSIRGRWCGTAVLIVFAVAMLAASITPALAYPISTPNYTCGDICVNTSGTGTLSAGSVSQNPQVAGWELWNNSKSIHINNTGGSALTYYQINISIPDGINETSLRVVNETSNAAVPHWCENCTGGKCYELWFNATYIPASSWCTTYAVYYGNDTASSMSDYNATFTKSYNTSGLVMELNMDEGSGNIRTNDTSGCGNNGTLTNMNVTGNATSGWQGVDGGQWDSRSDVVFSGDQLQFDGTNDYVNVPDHPTLGITGHITLEAWVNFSSINSRDWTGLVTKWDNSGTGRGYGLFKHRDTDKIAFICSPAKTTGSADAQADSSPTPNTWYHVAGTYNGSIMWLYINGILQSDTGAISPASIYNNSEPVEIGTFEEYQTTFYFDGAIDEVRIYNRSLSGDEIYRQYLRSKYAANAPTVTISAAPVDTTPHSPTPLANTTGNYWVNYTWTAGNGVITDGYNVSMNKGWHNGTKTFLNSDVGAGNWSNITVWAWNKTGSGNMSANNVHDTVQAPSAPAAAPNITSYAPATPVISDEGATARFNVTVNQTVNATWYINGSVAQPNTTASTEVAYTNASAAAGYWNVSVLVNNTNGIDMQTWWWTVNAVQSGAPNITSWDNNKTNNDSTTITINESESVRFNATANQTIVTWNWHNNGTLVRSNNFDNYATSWDVNGTHSVSVNVTNTNGTSSMVTWTIRVNDITAPAQVRGLTNNTPTATTVDLSWTANTEADLVGYRVYRNGMLLGSPAHAYYNATGLSSSSAYEFNVSAYDDNGLEGANASIVVTTAVGPLHHINVTDSKTLNISESWNFTATGCDKNNGAIPDLVFAWARSDEYVGNFTLVNDTTTNFTAEHVGVTYITASNGSVTSGWVPVTVNAPPETGNITNGTGNATSGNSTAIVWLKNKSINGTITIKELGDPLNGTEDIGNRTGLGTDSELIKGVNVTVNGSIATALNDTGSYVHIRVEYNESQLGDIDENTLHIYKFVNGTGWVRLVQGSNYCIANGRNTTANYVGVNVTNCSIFLLAGTPAPTPTLFSGGGEGTYPPGWFETPTPTVTAAKSPAASATATDAPPGERVTPAATKAKPAAAKATAPAAEGMTAGTAKEDAPGFTAVFVIAGMLAAVYVVMRRRM